MQHVELFHRVELYCRQMRLRYSNSDRKTVASPRLLTHKHSHNPTSCQSFSAWSTSIPAPPQIRMPGHLPPNPTLSPDVPTSCSIPHHQHKWLGSGRSLLFILHFINLLIIDIIFIHFSISLSWLKYRQEKNMTWCRWKVCSAFERKLGFPKSEAEVCDHPPFHHHNTNLPPHCFNVKL